jgi:hypothetical protein
MRVVVCFRDALAGPPTSWVPPWYFSFPKSFVERERTLLALVYFLPPLLLEWRGSSWIFGSTLCRGALRFVVQLCAVSIGLTPVSSFGATLVICRRGTLIDVVAPVSIPSNRMAIVVLFVVLGAIAGPWHILRGGGGAGGECCVV